MGYHVSITTKSREFNLSDFNKIKEQLINKYGFREQLTDSGTFNFFEKPHDSYMIFFTPEIGLWVKNADDQLLEILINIARDLGDEYYVIGDENEIYHSMNNIELQNNINNSNKIGEIFINFIYEYLILLFVILLMIFLKIIINYEA